MGDVLVVRIRLIIVRNVKDPETERLLLGIVAVWMGIMKMVLSFV